MDRDDRFIKELKKIEPVTSKLGIKIDEVVEMLSVLNRKNRNMNTIQIKQAFKKILEKNNG